MYTDFYKDALFSGMTSNAFKLGTILSLGWFWQRVNGCSVLYRGTGIDTINFDNILAVESFYASQIQPPTYIEHLPDSSYYYVLRKVNCCGDIELTFSAVTKVDIGPDGKLADSSANSIFILKADIIESNKVRLTWFYCLLRQNSKPFYFNIYSDNGTGIIDYQNNIAQVKYEGRKFYSLTTEPLQTGKHLFAVRVENASGNEDKSQRQISVEVTNCYVENITIVIAKEH